MSSPTQVEWPALATPGSTAGAPAKRAGAQRKSRRFLVRGFGLLASVTVIAAGAYGSYRYTRAHAAPLVRYQTATIDRGTIAAKVTASGSVSAIVTVQVGAQVSGRIEHWYADFNTPVKAGQLIATLEPSLFKAAVDQANANDAVARAAYRKAVTNRQLAQRTYERELALFRQDLASRADLDAAEAQEAASGADVQAAEAATVQARAALEQARLNLGYTKIASPIDGVIISRNIDVGQTVAASFQAPTLFTIAKDLTKMQVDTNVAEGDVGKIRSRMPATFTVDAYPTRVFQGIVRQVRNNATTIQNVVTYDAVIDVDNPDLALLPTMTANASFVYATKADVLRIPNAALRFKPDAATVQAMVAGSGAKPPLPTELAPDRRVVWLLRGGRALPQVVRIGIGDGMATEIAEGSVQNGDVVVTEALAQGVSRH